MATIPTAIRDLEVIPYPIIQGYPAAPFGVGDYVLYGQDKMPSKIEGVELAAIGKTSAAWMIKLEGAPYWIDSAYIVAA